MGLAGLSVFGATQLTLGLNPQVSVIEDSTLFKYFGDQSKYLEAGPLAYVVLENINYTDPFQLSVLKNLSDTLSDVRDSKE